MIAADRMFRPRRVLMTVDAVGGVWRYAMEAAAGLAAYGITTIFAGLGPPPSDIMRAEAEHLGTLTWLEQPLDWMITDPAALDGIPREIERLVQQTGAELVHLNLPSQAAGLDLPQPTVVVSHSCVVTWFEAVHRSLPPDSWQWQGRLNAEGFAQARVILAPSQSHADLLIRCYGLPSPVAVVPNAVDALQPATERKPYVFAAARWWDEAKNANQLDHAASMIAWPLFAAGALDGPSGQSTRFSHARAVGQLSQQAVRSCLEHAAIFVSPSRYEPFGLATLEAASGGCALVLADIPTYREIWHDAALFVPVDRGEALADAANQLIGDVSLRRTLAERARVRATTYTRARQAASLLDCYARAA